MSPRGRKWFVGELDPNLALRGVVLLDLTIKLLLMGGALWPVLVAWRRWWPGLSADWQRVLFILGLVLLFSFGYLAGLLILRVLIPRPREGVFRIKESQAQHANVLVFLLNILLVKARFEPPWSLLFAPAITNLPGISYLYHRLFGPHTKTVLIGENFILTDPHYTYIGRNVTVGLDCIIGAHIFEGRRLLIRRVEIGDNVIIGARAMIGPGAQIGDGAVIGSDSMLLPHTQIGPGELWMGSPAKQVTEWQMSGGDHHHAGLPVEPAGTGS